jgi:NAD(P)-dependent dehydrogenase (short-subunit alcohol dehydrogenase family)
MLKNQVALVTGVSSGIGRETASLLAEHGARVFGEGVILSRLRRFIPAGLFDRQLRKEFQLDHVA